MTWKPSKRYAVGDEITIRVPVPRRWWWRALIAVAPQLERFAPAEEVRDLKFRCDLEGGSEHGEPRTDDDDR